MVDKLIVIDYLVVVHTGKSFFVYELHVCPILPFFPRLFSFQQDISHVMKHDMVLVAITLGGFKPEVRETYKTAMAIFNSIITDFAFYLFAFLFLHVFLWALTWSYVSFLLSYFFPQTGTVFSCHYYFHMRCIWPHEWSNLSQILFCLPCVVSLLRVISQRNSSLQVPVLAVV